MDKCYRMVGPEDLCADIADIYIVLKSSVQVLFVLRCSFAFCQHLRSYQDGYRVVTVCTHNIIIVLPKWETMLANTMNLISHSITLSWHLANQSLSYPINAEHLARKRQVSILKSLVWLDQYSDLQGPDSNLWGSDSPIFQHGRRTLYSFSHLIWSACR